MKLDKKGIKSTVLVLCLLLNVIILVDNDELVQNANADPVRGILDDLERTFYIDDVEEIHDVHNIGGGFEISYLNGMRIEPLNPFYGQHKFMAEMSFRACAPLDQVGTKPEVSIELFVLEHQDSGCIGLVQNGLPSPLEISLNADTADGESEIDSASIMGSDLFRLKNGETLLLSGFFKNNLDSMYYNDGTYVFVTFSVRFSLSVNSLTQLNYYNLQLYPLINTPVVTFNNVEIEPVIEDIEVGGFQPNDLYPPAFDGSAAPEFVFSVTDDNTDEDNVEIVVEGESYSPDTFEYGDDSATVRLSSGSSQYELWDNRWKTALADGTYSCTFNYADLSGNTISSSFNIERDSTPPTLNPAFIEFCDHVGGFYGLTGENTYNFGQESPLPLIAELTDQLSNFSVAMTLEGYAPLELELWENPATLDVFFIIRDDDDLEIWDSRWNSFLQANPSSTSITIEAVDDVGNAIFYEYSVVIDVNAPGLTLNPAEDSHLNSPDSISLIIDDDLSELETVEYRLEGGDWHQVDGILITTSDPEKIQYQVTDFIDITYFSALEQGEFTFDIRVEDIAKNTITISRNYIKDTIFPVIAETGGSNVFGANPYYILAITDTNLDPESVKYTYGGTDYPIPVDTGQLDQDLWNLWVDGTYSIVFSCSDYAGNIGTYDWIITKDTQSSAIYIEGNGYGLKNELGIKPIFDGAHYFNVNPLTYNFYIVGEAATSYTFDDIESPSPTLHPCTLIGDDSTCYYYEGTVDQGLWDLLPGGLNDFTIYTIDSVSNEAHLTIPIFIDRNAPLFSVIDFPTDGSTFHGEGPVLEFNANDVNLESITLSYTSASASNMDFDIGLMGGSYIIDTNEFGWQDLQDGEYGLEIECIDRAYNIRRHTLTIKKDTEAPSIALISPMETLFSQSPLMELEITETFEVVDLQYTVNGQYLTQIELPTSPTGTFTAEFQISGPVWDSLFDGSVSIEVVAIDYSGLSSTLAIELEKDDTLPSISLVSPGQGAYCSVETPWIVIEYIEYNPEIASYKIGEDQFFVSFEHDGPGSGQIAFQIDSSYYGGLVDGEITVIFRLADELGLYNELAIVINIDKTIPDIIYSRMLYDEYYESGPDYYVYYHEQNCSIYVSADSGEMFELNGNDGELPKVFWDSLGYGTHILTYTVIDLAGNIDTVDYTIEKLDSAVQFNALFDGTVFGKENPEFGISLLADGDLLESIGYEIGGREFGIDTGHLSGAIAIDATLWSDLENGSVEITFASISVHGREYNRTVMIGKDCIGPSIEIVSPEIGSSAGVNAPMFIINIDEAHLKSVWYSLDGGTTKVPIALNELTSVIDQDLWDNALTPTVTIKFYAIDEFGNEGYSEIVVSRTDYVGPPSTGSHEERGDKIDLTLFLNMPLEVVGILGIIFAISFGVQFAFMKKRRGMMANE